MYSTFEYSSIVLALYKFIIINIIIKYIIPFPNFSSTKQGHKSKRAKTKTSVFVEALKRAVSFKFSWIFL